MIEGRAPTPVPVSVFLPSVFPSSLPYTSIDDLVGSPVEDHASLSVAAVDLHTADCLQDADIFNFSHPTPRMILNQTTPFGCEACLHNLFLSEAPDWTGGWPSFGVESTGPMDESTLASGLTAAYCAPDGWQHGLDLSIAHRSTHHAAVSVASVSPIRSTISYTSAAGVAQMDDLNVQVERSTASSQPAVGAPSVTGRAHARSPPHFLQPTPSSCANPPYVAYIAPFDAAIKTWYVVVVGWRVGVFASEPFFARSVKRKFRHSYFCYEKYEDALTLFQAAEVRGEVEERG
ncbi:hypothetical protein V8D89_012101 [Ganoderma adspersum]